MVRIKCGSNKIVGPYNHNTVTDILNTRFYDPVILSRYSPRIVVDGHGQHTFLTFIVTILFLAFLENHSREMLLETLDMLNRS